MTNYEKYKDEIIDELTGCSCNFIRNLMGDKGTCWDKGCEECERNLINWLNAEYTEEIDWDI